MTESIFLLFYDSCRIASLISRSSSGLGVSAFTVLGRSCYYKEDFIIISESPSSYESDSIGLI